MTEETNEQPGISLQQLASAVQIIDLAGERGAIKGEEMAAVGAVRTAFASFVEYAQAQQQANEPQAEPEATNEEAPTDA